jgi:hypothetical protein
MRAITPSSKPGQFRRLLSNPHVWVLGIFSVLYFAFSCRLAALKLLWYDELFTVYLARLPGAAAIWGALGDTDPHPPLNYLATHAAMSLFGEGPVVVRLPALLGFWLASVCLYAFVARHCPPTFACVAMLFPQMTEATYYAYEARPYGLVLGLGGVALLCWQAVEGSRRRRCLVGLTLSLAAALASHYYACLLFIPIGLGELARTILRRRVDWAVWAVLALALAPLACLWPLIQQARAYFGPTAPAVPSWDAVLLFYVRWLLPCAVLPLTVVLVFLAVYPRNLLPAAPAGGGPSWPELVVALGLVALPFFALALARLAVGSFAERYALPAVLGFGMLVAFVLHRRSGGSAVLGTACALVFFGCFIVRETMECRRRDGEARQTAAVLDFLREHAAGDTPVVVSSPLVHLQLRHYAPADLAARLLYLSDGEASRRHMRHDLPDRAVQALNRWADLNVVEYGPFVTTHPRFLLYGSACWVPFELVATGARLEVRAARKPEMLFDVVTPRAAALTLTLEVK